jgi:hypothetical protein
MWISPKKIQDGERATGNPDFQGFVFAGLAEEKIRGSSGRPCGPKSRTSLLTFWIIHATLIVPGSLPLPEDPECGTHP